MIKEKCFEKEWLESFKKMKDHKKIQVNILEKMVYALHLLEQLEIAGLDFIFKGGTSLVLLLEEESRFSIDIDIICNMNRDELENSLDKVCENSQFFTVELDEKRSYQPGVPKAHYAFKFESIFDTSSPPNILLDVLIEDPFYPSIIEVPIDSKWIEADSINTVRVPSIDSITGDKLTAFAPNTIGIPFYKGKQSFAMEICKQLFDVSRLFERIEDINVVNESFQAFAKQEILYRGGHITPDEVLQDIIDTCLIITKRDGCKKENEKNNFSLLSKGIKSFGSGYLMKGNFRIDDAVIASARVAFLAAKILKKDFTPIEYFSGGASELNIEDQSWNFLNRLKRQPDKSSFYYWYKAVKLLS